MINWYRKERLNQRMCSTCRMWTKYYLWISEINDDMGAYTIDLRIW